MENTNKSQELLIKGLQSHDTSVVLDAIKKNRKEGNVKSFEVLMNVLRDTDEPTVEAAIIEFLFDLKDQESVPVLMRCIRDKEFEYYRHFLIASFWQSAIDGSDELAFFVEQAIKGDYMSCLEALTVVENFDAAYNELELADLEADLQEAAAKEKNKDKKELLIAFGDVVRNLPIEGE